MAVTGTNELRLEFHCKLGILGRSIGAGKINPERRGDMEPEKYLTIYEADNSNPFWVCGVKDCRINFAHDVGLTNAPVGERKWKHVYADFYYSEPAAPNSKPAR